MIIFAVALVGYIVLSNEKKPVSGETKSVRVESSDVIKKEGSSDPKVVLSLYEDFLCPHCGVFEQQFGPTVRKLISTGAVAGVLRTEFRPRGATWRKAPRSSGVKTRPPLKGSKRCSTPGSVTGTSPPPRGTS